MKNQCMQQTVKNCSHAAEFFQWVGSLGIPFHRWWWTFANLNTQEVDKENVFRLLIFLTLLDIDLSKEPNHQQCIKKDGQILWLQSRKISSYVLIFFWIFQLSFLQSKKREIWKNVCRSLPNFNEYLFLVSKYLYIFASMYLTSIKVFSCKKFPHESDFQTELATLRL